MVITIQEYHDKYNGKEAMIVDSRANKANGYRSKFTCSNPLANGKFELNSGFTIFDDFLCFINEEDICSM